VSLKKYKDTEEEPLIGHELSFLRRQHSPSPAHHPIVGVLPCSAFADRGDAAMPKLLLKSGGVSMLKGEWDTHFVFPASSQCLCLSPHV